MAHYTAQVLIGEEHTNHGGLLPSRMRQAFLSENSVPVWELHSEDSQGSRRPLRWIPEKPDTILEDGVLMIAYHVIQDERVLATLASKPGQPVNLGDVGHEALEQARSACRESSFDKMKMIIVPFEGSSIRHQLSVISGYNFDCEVLAPKFSRVHSQWRGGVVTEGALD